MALPAYRKETNIRRSIQVVIGNTVTFGGVNFSVYHDYAFADPDDARGGPAHTAQRAWVETATIFQGAGRRGFSLFEANVYSRIGAEGEADGDPFGLRAEGIADEMESVFTGTTPAGAQRGCLQVMDFVNPAVPVGTSEMMVCQNSRGDVGEIEQRARPPVEKDLRRVTLTWRFRLVQDAAGPAAFYTG